jgi:hypothetical protein
MKGNVPRGTFITNLQDKRVNPPHPISKPDSKAKKILLAYEPNHPKNSILPGALR